MLNAPPGKIDATNSVTFQRGGRHCLPIDPNHSVVRLTHEIDWQLLEETAQRDCSRRLLGSVGQSRSSRLAVCSRTTGLTAVFQSQLRSTVRGKIGKDIEFGLKWGINQIRGGYAHIFIMKEMRSAD